jgi:hypothetical protein
VTTKNILYILSIHVHSTAASLALPTDPVGTHAQPTLPLSPARVLIHGLV